MMANQAACRRRRAKLKAATKDAQESDAMPDALVRHVVSGIRSRRTYTDGLVDPVARIGIPPSAGGARAPLWGYNIDGQRRVTAPN